MAWIRLPGLPRHMYKKKILWEIGGIVGRGRFARMMVYVNLGKALTSKVLINGIPQRIEYEHLPTSDPGTRKGQEKENSDLEETQSTFILIQQSGRKSGIEATGDKANNTKNERQIMREIQ
ncbi:hypothetical protein J1N35_006114 [Gossypium stocksii]|uniref:DUF4283 domain-containing protein n=1 Tax=Gossypium stocksii TaxID=47602 RepID=A0A9D3WE94_9ROSI|nr:hypothetical protein J1N35_006114 [Gossypium stocksii]